MKLFIYRHICKKIEWLENAIAIKLSAKICIRWKFKCTIKRGSQLINHGADHLEIMRVEKKTPVGYGLRGCSCEDLNFQL